MLKRIAGVALALGLLTLSAVSLEAAVAEAEAPGDNEVNVTNTYWSPVQVYAEDSKGALHFLGRVDRDEFEIFQVPSQVSERGDFRIKVYPQDPDARSPRSLNGIKTQTLSPDAGQSVVLLLGRHLAASVVILDRG